eukprot:3917089-Rhodomonas_salina.1
MSGHLEREVDFAHERVDGAAVFVERAQPRLERGLVQLQILFGGRCLLARSMQRRRRPRAQQIADPQHVRLAGTAHAMSDRIIACKQDTGRCFVVRGGVCDLDELEEGGGVGDIGSGFFYEGGDGVVAPVEVLDALLQCLVHQVQLRLHQRHLHLRHRRQQPVVRVHDQLQVPGVLLVHVCGEHTTQSASGPNHLSRKKRAPERTCTLIDGANRLWDLDVQLVEVLGLAEQGPDAVVEVDEQILGVE